MHKQRSEYDSPIDTLVALAKRLSINKEKYRIASEEFFNKHPKGQFEDSVEFVEWVNDYQHYISLGVNLIALTKRCFYFDLEWSANDHATDFVFQLAPGAI